MGTALSEAVIWAFFFPHGHHSQLGRSSVIRFNFSDREGGLVAAWAISLFESEELMKSLESLFHWFILAVAATLAVGTVHAQTVVFVKPNTPNGDDGGSWSTAYDDLWTCLDELVGPGPFDIHVAAGIYIPSLAGCGQPIPPFPIREGVRIFGGFPGLNINETLADRDPDEYVVILSGDLLDPSNAAIVDPNPEQPCGHPESGACDEANGTPGCDDLLCCIKVCCISPPCCNEVWDCLCVELAGSLCGEALATRANNVVATVGAGENRRLDGVTVRDGGNGPGAFDANQGGGIWVMGNFLEAPVGLEIVRCNIIDNYASEGGGVAVTTGVPTAFLDDQASVRIWNCRIEYNTAKIYGGGLNAFGRSSYEVVNSVIAFNTYDDTGEPTQYVQGEGIFEYINVANVPRHVTNTTITRNSGTTPGIGMHTLSSQFHPDLMIVNSIVRGNTSVVEGEPVECEEPEDCNEIAGGATILYSNINEAPSALPLGCINVDPQFEDGPNGDFRLREGSLCVDAGDDSEVLEDDLDVNNNGFTVTEDGPDLALKIRVRVGGLGACPRVDMGAHELQGFCKLGDLNDDDAVDGSDTGIFLGLWGTCTTTPCPGDFNCDGTVDSADLGLLLGGWGPGLPRNCGTESLMGGGSEGFSGGSEQNGTSGLSLQELSDALGFPSMNAFVDWVTSLPFAEMEFYLSMIG